MTVEQLARADLPGKRTEDTRGRTKMRKLTIDRAIWLRGEGFYISALLRGSDAKMCCVGIYLEACGVSRDVLVDVHVAEDVKDLPEEARWLRKYRDKDGAGLYETNDSTDYQDEHVREDRIAAAFARNGVEVEYVGKGRQVIWF